MTVADFFCGAGGFSEGFRQKGYKVVFSLDNWRPAKVTHDLNHPECECVLMDILELDTPKKIDEVVPDTDVIIGSPPCVSFSGSNKAGKADKTLGVKLIEAYLGVVAWKMKKGVCKHWILENVPNSGNYIKDSYTWDDLGLPGGQETAIDVPTRAVLNAADYGAPQTRKRFVCGNYPMPEPTHEEGSTWVTMRYVKKCLTNPLDHGQSGKVTDPVYGFSIKKENLTDHFYDSRVSKHEWERAKRLKEDHGFMGKMSFPEDLDRPSRTVMATMSASTRESMLFGTGDGEYRLPTIREIASFMSFPLTYQFEGSNEATKYKLIGNAVCCKLSAALADSIARQEGKDVPEFIPLKNRRPSVDLTGMKRVPKKPKPRRYDAKFARHIPYIKVKSFRVELSNKDSDFSSNDIIWKSKIHYGSGKNAQHSEIDRHRLENMLSGHPGFESFKKLIESDFSDVKMSPKEFHESFVLNGSSHHPLSPDKALEMIRDYMHSSHDVEDAMQKFITNEKLSSIKRQEIPYLILAGAWACQYLVDIIHNDETSGSQQLLSDIEHSARSRT